MATVSPPPPPSPPPAAPSETPSTDAASTHADATKKPGLLARFNAKYGNLARTVISGGLCLLALLISGNVFAFLSGYKVAPAKKTITQQVYNVRTYEVQPRDYRELVSGFGTAQADRRVSVAAEVAGRVVQTHPDLEVGTEVSGPAISRDGASDTRRSEGELLVQIDPATYQRRLEQLQRAIDSDDVELRQLDAEEENTSRLIAQQKKTVATSQEELQSKQRLADRNVGNSSQLRSAKLALQQAEDALVRLQNELRLFEVREQAVKTRRSGNEANLESARLDVQRAMVRAPFDGQLSSVSVELGQYVRAGDAIAEITDLDHIEVPVALSQSQFARVEPLLLAAQRDGAVSFPIVHLAENETDEAIWTGRLVRAAPVANTDTRTVDVFVEVDNGEQPQPLLPGTFVHARIEGPVLKDALMVPRDAIVSGGVFVTGPIPDDYGKPPEPSDASETAAPGGRPSAPQPTFEIADIPEGAQVAQKRPIEVGRTVQTFAIIESGLEPGDEVVITNLDRLVDGKTLIRPQDRLTVEEELGRQLIEALRLE